MTANVVALYNFWGLFLFKKFCLLLPLAIENGIKESIIYQVWYTFNPLRKLTQTYDGIFSFHDKNPFANT